MKLVYIAGPYRAPDQVGVELNIARARRVAIALLKAVHTKPIVESVEGHCFASDEESRSIVEKLGSDAPFPVIPHMNTALFDFQEGITHIDADYWLKGTMRQMTDCSYVILVSPDAAQKSIGTRKEVFEANRRGIPVFEDVAAFLYYLEDAAFRSQVNGRVKEIQFNDVKHRVGTTLHIFGGPENAKPRTPKQVQEL